MLKQLLLLPLALLLGACSLAQYNVSEAEINQYLKDQVSFEKQLGIPGIMSSKIRLDEMQSRIGRKQADRIELHAAGDLQDHGGGAYAPGGTITRDGLLELFQAMPATAS